MQGLDLSPVSRRFPLLAWVALLAVVSPALAFAQTMLTNGSELFVRLPTVPDTSRRVDQLVNGDNSFTIFVPPGATKLTVEFKTDPGTPIELLVEQGQDVGTRGLGNRAAWLRAFPDNRGIATVEATDPGHPRLLPETYFIGFFVNVANVSFTGSLVATVEGDAIDSTFPLVISRFDSDLDGWTRNDTASPIPGTNVGHSAASLSHTPTGGNPGGYARYRTIAGGPDEWYVAPSKFHIDLLALNEPRIELDLARFTGGESATNVEIRVFSANGGYSWALQPPPPLPSELNPFTGVIDPIWGVVSAPIRPDTWRRVAGDDFFQVVFSEIERIEVRANYSLAGGSVGIDNFRIVERGIPPVRGVLPTVTSFSGGLDRWTSNYPEEEDIPGSTVGDAGSVLVWNGLEGNPEGHARLVENGGSNPDAFVAATEYLGDYSQLSGPRFEFDYRHTSDDGASAAIQIRLISRDGTVFSWTGAVPGDIWGRQVAPITADAWTLASGEASFEAAIQDVVRIEISADQAVGTEWNSLDNFSLLTDDSPPVHPSLTANPPALNLSGVATGPNPDSATIQITSSGETLNWQASVSGTLAERITLSDTSGDTPAEITLAVDSQGLEAGAHEAEVRFEVVGSTILPSVVAVTLNLDPQPVPTPVISQNGVVNSANNQPRLAAGALGTVYGIDLGGPAEGFSTSFGGRTGDLLPTNVSGLRVEVYSTFGAMIGEAPLLYLDNQQINFQMPFEAMGQSAVDVVVNNNGAASLRQTVQILSTSPGIFVFGNNRALATNQDGSLNSSDNPSPRREVITVYMTGQGLTAPEWQTGKAASSFPLIRAPSQTRVLVGGVAAKINFLGLAPGLVGVLQLNVYPVWETPLGDQPLVVNIGGISSNAATVSVR